MPGLPDNPSESFKRLNPHLYGIRTVETRQPKSTASEALVRHDEASQGGRQSLAILVSLVVLQRRTMDSDNLQGSAKPLRDSIAKSLGIDDGDPRITWEYSQQKTGGSPGVMVKIEAR